MYKDKGFTLVELLAVIVVLAVVLAIAIPTVSNIVDNAKARAFVRNEAELVKAAKDYFLTFRNGLPVNIGDTTEVQLSKLKETDFVNHIMSPYDNKQECTGYVLVTKIYDSQYSYTPHLNCVASIGSSATDKLIGHWTFDDFQEPTTNLVVNPAGSNITNPTPGAYKPGWDTSLHNDAITVATWTSGYNSGVASPTIGYHAKWVYKDGDTTNPIMCFIDQNNEYSLGHRWLGISQTFSSATSLGIKAGDKLTISWDQKANVLGKGGHLGLYHALISTGAYNFESNTSTINVKGVDKWERVSFTTTVGSNWDLTKYFNIYAYGYDGSYGKLWIDNIQMENKDHVTRFVDGTRTGTVKDYSQNNNKASLSIANTPTWTDKTMVGSGAYQFDGSNRYILTDSDINISGSQTFSAWIYPTIIDNALRGIVSLHNHSTTANLGLNLIYNGKLSISIGYADGTREYDVKRSTKTIPINKWSFVSLVYDSDQNKASIYIDGVLDSSFSITKPIKFSPGKLLIGEWSTTYLLNYNYAGSIDDVRLYNRVVSADEMLQLFNTHNY